MIYVICSNSYHIILEEVNKIFKNLNNVEIIDFAATNLEEIIETCNYTSLFNDKKEILIKNADFLGTKSSTKTDILEKYFLNQNPLTTIIFTSNDKIDERKKFIKMVKEENKLINIKPLTYKEIIDRIIAYFKNKKYKISYDNASYIANCCLNNYDLVMMELEKILLYYPEPSEILKEDLENIISKYLDDNNFKFVDAVINKDFKTSLKLLGVCRLNKGEPLGLISLLAREYRTMLISKSLALSGISSNNIAKKLNMQEWQIEKSLKNSYNYKPSELENKLLLLTDLDYQIKVGNIDKFLGLELFILKEQ